MKTFKQKYLKGIKTIQFIDEKTFNENTENLYARTYGMDVAFVIDCGEEPLHIITLKNGRYKEYSALPELINYLKSFYKSYSNKYLSNYISNLTFKSEFNKIAFYEFLESNRGLGILCDTQEKFNYILNELDRLGIKHGCLNSDSWHCFKEKTVYPNENHHYIGNLDNYSNDEKTYKIYKFEDIIFEE